MIHPAAEEEVHCHQIVARKMSDASGQHVWTVTLEGVHGTVTVLGGAGESFDCVLDRAAHLFRQQRERQTVAA